MKSLLHRAHITNVDGQGQSLRCLILSINTFSAVLAEAFLQSCTTQSHETFHSQGKLLYFTKWFGFFTLILFSCFCISCPSAVFLGYRHMDSALCWGWWNFMPCSVIFSLALILYFYLYIFYFCPSLLGYSTGCLEWWIISFYISHYSVTNQGFI